MLAAHRPTLKTHAITLTHVLPPSATTCTLTSGAACFWFALPLARLTFWWPTLVGNVWFSPITG